MSASNGGAKSRMTRVVKRCLDLVVSTALLLIMLPLMGAVAVAIRASMGSPILFRQSRPGLHGRIFVLLKFRTMTDARDAEGNSAPDAARLTNLGRVLRSTSLDEVPELWNVIKGEMSLVGPRPLLVEYLGLYSPEQARRHAVRPGVTGWAQVHGRNELPWAERLALDVWYVDNYSVALDVRILFRTLMAVLRREGISQSGHATAERFRGGSK